jgi:hypothetical protein
MVDRQATKDLVCHVLRPLNGRRAALLRRADVAGIGLTLHPLDESCVLLKQRERVSEKLLVDTQVRAHLRQPIPLGFDVGDDRGGGGFLLFHLFDGLGDIAEDLLDLLTLV